VVFVSFCGIRGVRPVNAQRIRDGQCPVGRGTGPGFQVSGNGDNQGLTARSETQRINEDLLPICDHNRSMETLFESISLALFVLAILTFVLVVCETFPSLGTEDQTSLRSHWTGAEGFNTWRKRDRAIKHAWNEHARRFPNSRKRLLFAALLIAAAISLMGHPLWYAFGSR
jgi:hypothetical protein